MIRRPPRSTLSSSSAASDVYKRQGYSELLLDNRYHKYAGLKDYSFAKYINGENVLRTEGFPYDKTDAEYVSKFSDYRIFRTGGFKHVLYKNGNTTVMISRPVLTIGDIVISL